MAALTATALLGAGSAARASTDAPAVARASDGEQRLRWKWRRFDAVDYSFTAWAGLGYLAVEFLKPPPSGARWTGGILFDDAVRRALVARDADKRSRVGFASDFFSAPPVLMMIIDSSLVPLLSDRVDAEVALHTSAIMAQAMAISGLLTRLGHHVIARERPDAESCERDPDYHNLCFRGRYASFPSGHVSGSFAAAGVTCVHHLHLPLYGGGWLEGSSCLASVTLASVGGYLRLVADRHYASDVVTGALLGAGSGFFVPWLWHYVEPDPQPSRGVFWMLSPLPVADSTGLGVVGWF